MLRLTNVAFAWLASALLPSSIAFPPGSSSRRRSRPPESWPLGAAGTGVEVDGEERPTGLALAAWLASRGADVGGCEVATFPGGLRGLRATRPAPPETVLIAVPLDLCLVTADVDAAGAAPAWSGELPNRVQLALQVLRHGSHAEAAPSPYGPYLASWPDGIPSLPANTPPEELRREAQRPVLFLKDMDRHRAWVRDQLEAVREVAPPSEPVAFSLEAFERAVQLVGSRSLALRGGGSALVPLVDMANHRPTPTAFYRHSDGAVELVATTDIAEGEEISIDYGVKSNSIMAKVYGFVPLDNPHDYELVTLSQVLDAAQEAGVLDEDPDTLEFAATALGLGRRTHHIRAAGPEEDLWLALRAALAGPQEHEELQRLLAAVDMDEADEEDLWDDEDEANVARRAEVMRAACLVFERRLSAESTLEEDEDRLRHDELSAGCRLLIELRKERKRLLRSAAQRMTAMLERS